MHKGACFHYCHISLGLGPLTHFFKYDPQGGMLSFLLDTYMCWVVNLFPCIQGRRALNQEEVVLGHTLGPKKKLLLSNLTDSTLLFKENHTTWNYQLLLVVYKGAYFHSCHMSIGLRPLTHFFKYDPQRGMLSLLPYVSRHWAINMFP